MIRVLAVAVAAALIAAPDIAGAQGKGDDALKASRFGISVDGVDVAKPTGPKVSGGKAGRATKSYKMQNAWPKKGY